MVLNVFVKYLINLSLTTITRKYYFCFSGPYSTSVTNCGLKYIRIPVLDDFVWDTVVKENMKSDLLQDRIDNETEKLKDTWTTLEKTIKYQKTTITDLEKQRDEINSLFISGKHSEDFLNNEMDKVIDKIDVTKKKYKELKEQLDKSGTDISLMTNYSSSILYYQNRLI